jgi:hypothetical protein
MSARTKSLLLGSLCAWQVFAGLACAADSYELWPELNLFYGLNERTRLHGVAAYADGKESDVSSLDVAAYVDVSFRPIIRRDFHTDDWQRSRYFWTRIGYVRVFDVTQESGREEAEDRGVVSFYGKAPLRAGVWLEARVRTDLRWIGDEYSARYRARAEATREFTLRERTVVPYLNCEWFYDTRYDGWARTLWMAGAEVTVNRHFRYEIYVAGQSDRLPDEASLAALGAVAKWYY